MERSEALKALDAVIADIDQILHAATAGNEAEVGTPDEAAANAGGNFGPSFTNMHNYDQDGQVYGPLTS